MKKVYIILLNYNGWKDTIECLESVLKSDYGNYQVIVVDNDSPNNSMDYIINWAEGKQEVIYDEASQLKHLSQPFEAKPLEYIYYSKEEALDGGDNNKENKLSNPLIFIQAGENGGFAAGNNIGIKYALKKNDFDYICLINNDTVVEKNFLSLIVKKMDVENDIGLCGGKILYYNKPNRIWFNGGDYNKITSQTFHHDYNQLDIDKIQEKKVTFLTGCLWVIRKSVLYDVGLLNESYFMYVEDLEYSFRTMEKGYELAVESNSKIYHKVGSSAGGEISEFAAYWLMRNRLYFLKNNSLFFYRMTSYIFILFSRIIQFPKWFYHNKTNIIKAQLRAMLEVLQESLGLEGKK